MSQKLKKKQREALGIIEDSGEELFEVSDVPDDAMPLLDDILFVSGSRSWSASNKYLPRKGINSDGMHLLLFQHISVVINKWIIDEPILRGYNDDDEEDEYRAQQSMRDKLKECWFRYFPFLPSFPLSSLN